ncbi:heme-binding domain-containing protein [Robiginitalea sp. SC105]|uniref:heme-binding domain-containing protein n=1 Tax=Robiginitalea sp. SC105 TaxID=2762332 RepID=UPI00163A9ABB|nr:heme-binding domain-containing protein [Robiginitalea sp. SC105]MBC2839467.1 heme-binding domain-containing protein [Robiginitalea sp. SC105]
MKIGKKIAWALLLIFVVMQFIRPEKNEDTSDHLAAFLSETNPPDPVLHVMKTSCFDCHSNHTVYPWYNQVAPINYWLADHIEHGKGHLNFSAWTEYDTGEKDHKLEEIYETVESGEMPLKEYTWTHGEARLTQEQRDAVMDWVRVTRTRLASNALPE